MSYRKYNQLRKIRDDLDSFLDESVKENVHVLIPRNLSRTLLITQCPPEADENKWLAGCYYILHTIIELSTDKRYFKPKAGSFVPLSSVLLKSICGDGYKKIFISNLIRLRVIECDEVYSLTRHESLGFRLSKRYRRQPTKMRNITHAGIKNAIIRNRIKRVIELKKRIRPIAHLARWSIDSRLQIDKEGALKYLVAYRERMMKEIEKRNLAPKYRDEEEAFTSTRYYKAVRQVESWGNAPRLSVDEAGGRLYTPVTGLLSPLRHFLSFDDQSLVSFDLKNSQPLHFLLFLDPMFWKKGEPGLTLDTLDKELYGWIPTLEECTTPSIMFRNIAKSLAVAASTNTNFRFLVQNGKLYEFISKRFYDMFLDPHDKVRFNTRNKTKSEVLRLMYFNPKERYSSSHLPFEGFRKLFPFEASVMSVLKKRNYRDFSVLLQKIEARVLLHQVGKQVYDISSDIPLFTVHDSIITTEPNADILESILVKTYTHLLGFPPPLKREVLNEEAAELERMKYVRGKIDQAEIELPDAGDVNALASIFPFLKCENWNIDSMLLDIQNPINRIEYGAPGVPDITLPKSRLKLYHRKD